MLWLKEMDAETEKMKVRKIERGIVIDHLKGATALRVLHALGIDEKFPGTVSVVMNVPSKRLGFKDIIKIEGRGIAKKELEKIALIAPDATINIISNYAISEKYRVQLPDSLVGLVKCPNPNCVSNHEGISNLKVQPHAAQAPISVRCHFCERLYAQDDLEY
jgi:aspartate carbamoyltransferase regulatory subunit